MTGRIVIRPEVPGDKEAIRAVHDRAFEQPDEGRIVDRQRADPRHQPGLSLVADLDGIVVGHCLLSICPIEGDGRPEEVLALGPIGVLPGHQGLGVGAALVEAAIRLGDERGFPAIVLLGHPTYYPRFGFEPARQVGLLPPAPWPDGSWMARHLSGWSPTVRGVVRYPPSFEPL